MGLPASAAQGSDEEEVGVPGSWETPAKYILNWRERQREQRRRLEGRKAWQAGGESKEDGGRSLVIRTFELQKS